MDLKRHIIVVTGLLGLSCLVQVAVIRRATVTGLDAVRFVDIARSIDQQGLIPTVRSHREQPLFPAWVWVVHAGLERIGGGFGSSWALSVQLAAAIPLVLAVVPLYLLMMRLIGPAAAAAGGLFFCLLPEAARLGADGISDSTHLLFFCLAFWAMVQFVGGRGSGAKGSGAGSRSRGGSPRGITAPGPAAAAGDSHGQRGSAGWLLLAGLATSMAVLARVEVLVLAAALAATLLWSQLHPARRRPWRGLAAAAGCFVLGLAAVLGPYLAAVGSLSPRAALARVLGRHQVQDGSSPAGPLGDAAAWRLTGGEPMSFDVKEASVTIRRRGYAAAVVRFATELAAAYSYWIGALALWGAWRLRRGGATAADRLVQVFFLLFSLAAIRFTAVEGYLVARHLLGLVVAGMASAGYGALHLGAWASRLAVRPATLSASAPRKRRPAKTPPEPVRSLPIASRNRPIGWAVIALAGIACLPQTLERLHRSRLGHRAAGRWLAAQAATPGGVLDTLGLTGLYSGRRTYPFEMGPTALRDPRLSYLVLERRELGYESRRSRTLRYLVETAGRPAAEFPAPAAREVDQQAVVVYPWYPDRFGRRVAARPATTPK